MNSDSKRLIQIAFNNPNRDGIFHPALSRRRFLVQGGVLGALPFGGVALLRVAPGKKVPLADAFDGEMDAFMAARKVPGGALAVVKDRRLVYARGYVLQDREKREPVRPDSLFRIASISKPFTAVAVLKLVEAGRLNLDAPAFELMDFKPVLEAGKTTDVRLQQITVRHLLHHTGGWDRDKSGDPMFRSREIARVVGVLAPARQEAIIRYMLGRTLDADPGARYAYSNFGYCALGRLIEKLSGRAYDQFIRETVLGPMNIRRMRLGASLESGRTEGEVKYYMPSGDQGRSVFPDVPGSVPEPYGTFCLEAMDSHGGWLASAVDLAKFAAALDAPGRILKPETERQLYEPPAPPVSRKEDSSLRETYYACGWQVRPVGRQGKANYWHNGSLPGTFTLLVRRFEGLAWAALFNQRSADSKLPDGAIDPALHRAADTVAEWPAEDLFPKYGG